MLADAHKRVKGGYTYKSHRLFTRYGTDYGNYLGIIVFDFYFDNSEEHLKWKKIEDDIHNVLDKLGEGESGYRVFPDRELYKLYDDSNNCLMDTYLTKVRDFFLGHPVQKNVYLRCLQKRRSRLGKLIM